MRTFKLGDTVILKPESRDQMAKRFLLYNENLTKSFGSYKDKVLKVGGAYEVLSKKKLEGGGSLYQLILDNEYDLTMMTAELLVLESGVKYCPFSIGDTVTFKNGIPKEDKYLCEITNIDMTATYTITKILNKLYVYLDSKHGPYPWEHFEFREGMQKP